MILKCSVLKFLTKQLQTITKKRQSIDCLSMLALPIFPGRRQPSIVDRNELNYRVRNGNGWTLAIISTNSMYSGFTGEQTVLYCIPSLLSRTFVLKKNW